MMWLIYWAEVLDDLNHVAGIGLFVCGFALFGFMFAWLLNTGSYCSESEKQRAAACLKWARRLVLYVIPLLAILSVFTPNAKTLYLMAGVTVAEDMFSTPEAAKARQLLNEKLDGMLENMEQDE